jgi:hypothetical protein
MEKIVPKMSAMSGVKAVYRNGELIYRYQEYKRETGVKEDGDLRITRYDNPDERI